MAKQMYKIFINQQFIIFSHKKPSSSYCKNVSNPTISNIKKIVKSVKNGTLKRNYCISSQNYIALYKEFKANFDFIKAAGGLVLNKKGNFLAIYRIGKWDLPKGKIDNAESLEDCAKREIMEECGVNHLQTISKLPSTYHVFLGPNNKWKLKKTHWYKMKSIRKEKLVPLTKERIERCEWMPKERLIEFIDNTYPGIKELIISSLF